MNPTAQGSSLTEGKRSKRSKKGGAENGDLPNNQTVSLAGDSDAAVANTAEVDIKVPKVVPEEVLIQWKK